MMKYMLSAIVAISAMFALAANANSVSPTTGAVAKIVAAAPVKVDYRDDYHSRRRSHYRRGSRYGY